jgi:hypothetical protein
VAQAGDCNDDDNSINPGATEICDGKDNNCNGQVDEGLITSNTTTITACDTYTWAVNGQMYTTSGTYTQVIACNTEILVLKINSSTTWYRDNDSDGYGDVEVTMQACAKPDGYVAVAGDCNDDDNTIYPGATEICDGKDNNCNGQVDEGLITSNTTTITACDTYTWAVNGQTYNTSGTYTQVIACNTEILVLTINSSSTWYLDNDSDGYGDVEVTMQACAKPDGYVAVAGDCNDDDNTIYPGATEICDGKDNNCNGQVDEGLITSNTTTITACDTYTWIVNGQTYNTGGTYTYATGCNTEILVLTINTSSTWYRDNDSDGYGDVEVTLQACAKPDGYVAQAGDCNDNNAAINPGATEICGNGIDENCNGQVDEGCIVCPIAENLSATGIKSNAATLNWTAAANPQQWQVRYRPNVSAGKWTETTGTGTSRTLSIKGLSAGTSYSWQIRAMCNGVWQPYSLQATFTTTTSGGKKASLEIITMAAEPVLKVYPNPARGSFMVSLQLNERVNAEANIVITDISGKNMMSEKAITVNGLLQKKIQPVNEMTDGIYIIRIMVNGQAYHSKLLYKP